MTLDNRLQNGKRNASIENFERSTFGANIAPS